MLELESHKKLTKKFHGEKSGGYKRSLLHKHTVNRHEFIIDDKNEGLSFKSTLSDNE
jgi:hypothetical protein